MADAGTTPSGKLPVEIEGDVNVEFNEASSRQQINSGESIKTLFGKIRKFLTDLKAVAFSGAYSDLSGAPDLSEYVKTVDVPNIKVNEAVDADYATNAGNANTVNGYNIRCEDVATPKYNWFATFDNDSLSGINPERAYVGNAGNAITANTVKTMSVIGTASDVTYNSVLEWVNSVNGFGTACLINAYGYPPDTPIQSEGFLTVETCYQNLRKYVTFKTFDGTKIYERAIWSGAWATEWRDIYTSGNKPYVTGTLSEQASDSPVTMSFTIFDFTPSKVICQFGDGSAFFANVVTNGFSLTIPAGTTTIHYIAFK